MRTLVVPIEDDLDEALDAISARTGRDKQDILEAAVRHYIRVEQRFAELAATWRRDTAHLSSVAAKSSHPAYLEIIRMGQEAVPLILRELAHKPDHWFPALRAITGADPVPSEDAGRVSQMARAWLRWGEEQGYAA